MNYFGIVGLLNGFFALFSGLYLLVKNHRNPLYLSCASFAISVSLWSIFYAFWQFQTDRLFALWFIRLAMAFCSYIPFAFLWFTWTIIEDPRHEKIHPTWLIPPALFFISNFTPWMVKDVQPRLYFPFWPVPGFLMHIYLAIFLSVLVYCFTLLFRGWVRASGIRRWQLKWVTITSLLAWLGGSTNWFLWYNIPIPPISNVFVGVFFLLLAYAVMRRQLFDIDTLTDIVQEAKLSAIGTLAASINHEIRNPLFVVKGLAESFLVNFREGLFDHLTTEERQKKFMGILEKTIEQISRAVEITKKFSEFSRPRVGPAIVESVSINDVIYSVLSFVNHELELDKIKVEKELSPNIFVNADEKQLEEIFLNLMVNACQAMPNGGVLRITSERENGRLSIQVSDTGVGISTEVVKHIFEPFYSTKKEKGSGLGLYIVKKLVERNGGRIKVSSQVDKGTIFTVDLLCQA